MGKREKLKKATPAQINEGIEAFERFGPDGGASAHDQLLALQDLVDSQELVEIGNLCLASAGVEERQLKRLSELARSGSFEAVLIGEDVDWRVYTSTPTTIKHSYIAESVFEGGGEMRIADGCSIVDSVVQNANLWDTRLQAAYARGVRGSSGGNTLTGWINEVNIAASGEQVFITPKIS